MTRDADMKKISDDHYVAIEAYICDGCDIPLNEMGFVFHKRDSIHFCRECSFRLRFITQKEYKEACGVYTSCYQAFFLPSGEIKIDVVRTKPNPKKHKTLSTTKRFHILSRDKYRCVYCGETSYTKKLEVDHIKPRSEGGTDDIKNLVTACRQCNIGKSNLIIRGAPCLA